MYKCFRVSASNYSTQNRADVINEEHISFIDDWLLFDANLFKLYDCLKDMNTESELSGNNLGSYIDFKQMGKSLWDNLENNISKLYQITIPYSKSDLTKKNLVMIAYKQFTLSLNILICTLFECLRNEKSIRHCRNLVYNICQNYSTFLEHALSSNLKMHAPDTQIRLKIDKALETLNQKKTVKISLNKDKSTTLMRRKNEFALSLLKNFFTDSKNEVDQFLLKKIKEISASNKVSRKPKETIKLYKTLKKYLSKPSVQKVRSKHNFHPSVSPKGNLSKIVS